MKAVTAPQIGHQVTQASPEIALALLLETACEQFETLRMILSNEISLQFTKEPSYPLSINRIKYSTTMALAKSFLANVVRARRICERGASLLPLDRDNRRIFLKETADVVLVRDVNEHGLDIDAKASSKPSLHDQGNSYGDETSMTVAGFDRILMGPINLCEVYPSVARLRAIAGFAQVRAKAPINSRG